MIHLMDVPLADTFTGGPLGIEDDEQTTERAFTAQIHGCLPVVNYCGLFR